LIRRPCKGRRNFWDDKGRYRVPFVKKYNSYPIQTVIGLEIIQSWSSCRKSLSKELMVMMMLRISLMIMVLCICYPSFLRSATLDEAVEYALRQNPDLRSLRLEEEVAKAQLQKAKLPLIANPSLETAVVAKGKGGDVERTFIDYGLGLSQEFEIAGQRSLRIDVAEKEIQRVSLEIRDKERTIISEVRNAFTRVLASKRRGELRKEAVRLKEELLDFTNIKFKAGDVSGLEINIAELELGKAKTELLSAEREYKESILSLQDIMGHKPDVDFKIDGEILSDVLGLHDKEELKRNALANRPDLKASQIEEEKTRSAINLARREAFPNVTVSAFYERDELRNTGGLRFSIPLPLIDRKQAEKKIAKIRSEQTAIRHPNLQRIIEKEVEEGHANLVSSYKEVELYKKEMLNKALENLDLLNLAFREGKIGFYDVRLAQKDALDFQFAYVDALLRAQISIDAMKRITGGELK
jgi:cobalt-zinc-cadmium efflux system outer membrane protein